jgi:hypothetical protein
MLRGEMFHDIRSTNVRFVTAAVERAKLATAIRRTDFTATGRRLLHTSDRQGPDVFQPSWTALR